MRVNVTVMNQLQKLVAEINPASQPGHIAKHELQSPCKGQNLSSFVAMVADDFEMPVSCADVSMISVVSVLTNTTFHPVPTHLP
jgi:hypothetical protein